MSQWKLAWVAQNWQNWQRLCNIMQSWHASLGNFESACATLRHFRQFCAHFWQFSATSGNVVPISDNFPQLTAILRNFAQFWATLWKVYAILCNFGQFCQFLATFVNFHCDMGPTPGGTNHRFCQFRRPRWCPWAAVIMIQLILWKWMDWPI